MTCQVWIDTTLRLTHPGLAEPTPSVDGHLVTAQTEGDGLGQLGAIVDHERVPGMLRRTVRRGFAS